MSDLTTNKARLFALMRDGQWHHMRDLQHAGGWRYGGRLHELQQEGWPHEKRALGNNEWEYRLLIHDRQLVLEV